MARPHICLICHKISPTPGDEEEEDPLGSSNDLDDNDNEGEEDWTKVEERMKIFIRFLRSYLNLDKDKSAARWEEMAITGGILTCVECSKTVDSFCELYEEMKAIELRLQSKLQTMTNVMFLAQGGALQMEGFREAVANRLGLGGDVASKMVRLKREIVAKGRQKLEAASQYLTPEEDPLALPDDLNEASSSSTVPCPAKSAGSSKSRQTQARMRQRQRHPPRHPTPEADWLPPDSSSPDVVKKEEESDSMSFEEDVTAPDEAIMSRPFPEPIPAPGLPLSSIVTATPTKSGKLKISSSKNPTTGLFTCPLCPKEFKLRKCITGHYQAQHLNIRYECTKCNKEFTRRPAYIRHYQHVHMGVRKFKCDSCNSSFTRKCHLDVHNPQKCGERMKLGSPVITGPSPKTTAKGSREEDPQKKSQTSINRFKQEGFRCRPCKLSFPTAKAHRRHYYVNHKFKGEGSPVCDICGKVSATRQLPFKCHI